MENSIHFFGAFRKGNVTQLTRCEKVNHLGLEKSVQLFPCSNVTSKRIFCQGHMISVHQVLMNKISFLLHKDPNEMNR